MQIPRWVQIKWIEGLAGREIDHHAPIAWQVTGGRPGKMPFWQESPKVGVGSPAGFARGAGREWALPVVETKRYGPETPPISKARKAHRGIRE